MTERSPGRVAVLSRSWGCTYNETAFVTRSVAAALSRLAPVDILVPGLPGTPRPDGAFDLYPVGGTAPGPGVGSWPAVDRAQLPDASGCTLCLVEGDDPMAVALAHRHLPGVPTIAVVSEEAGPDVDGRPPALAVGVGGGAVGLHVPVHELAAARRHVGLGFTGYLLVLGDRGPEAAGSDRPSALAAWLAARFASRHVVVIENAVASVWRARSLRGLVAVDTRTDLWRLVAHARVTVDLAPGALVARECVESLLYGVPVVVPGGSAGARLASAGGGLWFDDEAELFGCVEALDDDRVRETLGSQGRTEAARWYGDADDFVHRVGEALGACARWPLAPDHRG